MSAETDGAGWQALRDHVARALWETFFYKPNQDEEAWAALRSTYQAKADEFLAHVLTPERGQS